MWASARSLARVVVPTTRTSSTRSAYGTWANRPTAFDWFHHHDIARGRRCQGCPPDTDIPAGPAVAGDTLARPASSFLTTSDVLERGDQLVWLSSRSEEHTSELQSRVDLVCRLLLEKKKKKKNQYLSAKKKKRKN